MMQATKSVATAVARHAPAATAGFAAGFTEQTIRQAQQPANVVSFPVAKNARSFTTQDGKSLAETKLSFLGCGNMGSALLQGWLDQGTLTPGNISVNKRSQSDSLSELQKQHAFNLNIGDAPKDKTDIALLTVKPAQVAAVLESTPVKADCYVSVAAGLPLEAYEKILGEDQPIIRVMPNTPSAIGAGMTAIVANKACKPHHIENAKQLFEASGKVIVLDSEDKMHAFTALAGSGPAYVFATIEAWEKSALDKGFTPEEARTIAYQTVVGSAEYAQQSPLSASQLRENVTSPGGTTQAGLNVFQDEKAGVDGLLKGTVDAAEERSREMSKT